MSKWVLRSCLFFVFALILVNFRWVHAGLAYSISEQSGCNIQLLESAHERVAQLFGSVESKPLIGCLKTPVLGLGNTIGTTNFAPGLPSVILLNHEGEQLDVMAHEWAHAEFVQRIGLWHRELSVPTWFDEGLAMQVDLREGYQRLALQHLLTAVGRGQLQSPHLESLKSPSEFFRTGDQGKLHYAFSRCVVQQLLKENSVPQLMEQWVQSTPPTQQAQMACLTSG